VLSVVAALLAAVFFALSSVTQHRAASTSDPSTGLGFGLVRRLATRPLWLVGVASDVAGLAMQALALATGALVVVQPLLLSGLLFALPASMLLERRAPRRGEWGWAVLVVAGLSVFLVAARPAAGSALADSGAFAGGITGVVAAAGVVVLVASTRMRHRAALLGVAAGLSHGVVAPLIKQIVGQSTGGVLVPLQNWELYAVMGVGVAAFVLIQTMYQSGRLAASLPPMTIVDPVVAVALGAVFFGEQVSRSPLALTVQALGFMMMTLGVVRLSALNSGALQGRPAPCGTLPSSEVRTQVRRWVPAPGVNTRAVLILSASVGAGHDGAADELAERLRRSGVDVDVRDYMNALPRWGRFLLRDCYSPSVRHTPLLFEWLFTTIENSRVVRAVVLTFCRLGNRTVRMWISAGTYSTVVSTYPLASQTLGELRASGRVGCPVVTYLTDPAAHRTWVHPDVDVHLTVTAATAAIGEHRYSVPLRVGGPLVPARFASAPSPDRLAQLRRDLMLPADKPVALFATGSLGLGDAAASARDAVGAGLTPLVLCGRNEVLRQRLSAVAGVIALGWRTDVHELMHLADVLVQNAGGLSFTEAMVAGLPVVSYRCIPGHGQANAAILQQAGLAPWALDATQFAALLRQQAARGRTPSSYDDPARHILRLIEPAHSPEHRPRVLVQHTSA